MGIEVTMSRSKQFEYDGVALRPFIHQVGGHSSVLSFDQHTVCKPMVRQEMWFYQNLPSSIRQFTPEYKGVVEVKCVNHNNGDMAFVAQLASLPERIRRDSAATDDDDSRSSFDDSRSSFEDSSSDFESPTKGVKRPYPEEESSPSSSTNQDGGFVLNPWSLQCHRRQVKRLQKGRDCIQKFILLENLTSRFYLPCILDLKMGTRQHGDDAPREKRLSQMAKCANSTSKSLGVRLCGMQMYRADSKRYDYHDKYYGRSLNADGFKDALRNFFDNGYKYRTDILQPIISRLSKLQHVLSEQHSFRFYSSSLLIMYDGKEHRQCQDSRSDRQHPKLMDVRIIDFAHSTQKDISDGKVHDGPDTGFLLGLENLIKILGEIRDEVSG